MKYGAYIGRFQIVTNAHLDNIVYALDRVDQLFVVCGSAFGPLDDANPFFGFERRQMLIDACKDRGIDLTRITFLLVDDYPDDNEWARNVKNVVNSQAHGHDVYLVGMNKDASSFYLNMFPEWKSIECPKRFVTNSTALVSATTYRRMWLTVGPKWFVETDHVPKSVVQFLTDFVKQQSARYKAYQEELAFYDKHRNMWKDAPFPPTFNTSDCAIFYGPHVALVQRKKAPGQNSWALPGGYVEADETYEAAARREGKEETCVDLVNAKLIDAFDVDTPRRSRRGRIFTKVHLFDANGMNKLPQLVAADDAMDAKWFTESTLSEMKHKMFEDHWWLATESFKRYNYITGRKL